MGTQIKGTAEDNTRTPVSFLESRLWKSKEGVWGFPFIQPVAATGSLATCGCLYCKILETLCNIPVHSDMQFHYRLIRDKDRQLPQENVPHIPPVQPGSKQHHSSIMTTWAAAQDSPSSHDLEFHRHAALCLIRGSLPYQIDVPNCYFLNRCITVIFNEGGDVGKEEANIRNCF